MEETIIRMRTLAHFADLYETHGKYGSAEWVLAKMGQISEALRSGADKQTADAQTIADLTLKVKTLEAEIDGILDMSASINKTLEGE